MSTVSHYDQGELALFAMQLLPPGEHAAMAAHIAGCASCRQELAQLQGDLAAVAHAVETHPPAAQVRERFLQQIAHEKKLNPAASLEADRATPPSREEVPERRERPEAYGSPVGTQQDAHKGLGDGRYRDEGPSTGSEQTLASRFFGNIFPWIGWAAAAGLAVAAASFYHEREAQRVRLDAQAGTIDRLSADAAVAKRLLETITDVGARQVTLTRTADKAPLAVPQGHATYVAYKGALIFLASNLEPVATYKTYELWLIPADGRDPIPAGTFRPDARGNASVILPPLPKGIEAKTFGVTLEDEGGSQTPTMPILLAGS